MESLLNILWMLIAVSLLWAWRTQWVPQRCRTIRHSVREWSAVSVALVLLFFAVSMTDDLHAEVMAVEDRSISKRDLICPPSGHAPPQSGKALHASSWTIVPIFPFFGLRGSRQNLPLVEQLFGRFVAGRRASGRAPPASST